jgi:hypothetical protein
MKRNKSTVSHKAASDVMDDATASKEVKNLAATSRLNADLAVERGSQALARHASRKQFVLLWRWLAITTLLVGVISIIGYLAYPNVAQMPWQRYFDRFDFRLQPAIEKDNEKQPDADPNQASGEDP